MRDNLPFAPHNITGNKKTKQQEEMKMTEREIERILAEEADEAKVWEAVEEYLKGAVNDN